MDVDKNLFLYNLAVVAIMKNEGPYIKEWLDYHLLAGVDHFFIYNNESPDNQSEVVQPYVDAGLVTYIDYPGKARQYEAYNAAVRDYKFYCRYMTFIDGDEFIFPQDGKSILDVTDEVLEDKLDAAALCANWHVFGSNYQEKFEDIPLLERFTRCEKNINHHVKTIADPRKIDFFWNPHFAMYFTSYWAVNEHGAIVKNAFNEPPTADKIVIHHYYEKSNEEFEQKIQRGVADSYQNVYKMKSYTPDDKNNEVFDDSILTYRDARIKKFLPADGDIIKTFAEMHYPNCDRLLQAVTSNLLPGFKEEDVKKFLDNPKNRFEYFAMLVKFFSIAPPKFFENRTETFLTCFAVSSFLKDNFVDEELGSLLEEFSLNALYKSLIFGVKEPELQLFVRELPKILPMPYPVVNELRSACFKLIPKLMESYRTYNPLAWLEFIHMDYTLNLLKVFDSYINK